MSVVKRHVFMANQTNEDYRRTTWMIQCIHGENSSESNRYKINEALQNKTLTAVGRRNVTSPSRNRTVRQNAGSYVARPGKICSRAISAQSKTGNSITGPNASHRITTGCTVFIRVNLCLKAFLGGTGGGGGSCRNWVDRNLKWKMPGSPRSMWSYVLSYPRLENRNLCELSSLSTGDINWSSISSTPTEKYPRANRGSETVHVSVCTKFINHQWNRPSRKITPCVLRRSFLKFA